MKHYVVQIRNADNAPWREIDAGSHLGEALRLCRGMCRDGHLAGSTRLLSGDEEPRIVVAEYRRVGVSAVRQ